MSFKDEDTIGKLLRELPVERASLGFKSRVMAGLSRPSAPPVWSRALLPAAAVIVVVALLIAVPLILERGTEAPGGDAEAGERTASRQRVEMLHREYQTLERELAALRTMAAESQPVIGVQGDDQFDYLIDLRDVLPLAAPARGQIRPVSYDAGRYPRRD